MATHKAQTEKNTAYFVTFTCYKWYSLIEMANAFPAFEKWFTYLPSIRVMNLGYVIMPNHFHGILYLLDDCPKTINQIISNAKRFLAYEMVAGLKYKEYLEVLSTLQDHLTRRERVNGQRHKVFVDSFDAKEILTKEMLIVKLEYMHRNPCHGKWALATDFTKYAYSSAAFYENNEPNQWITDYRNLYV